MRTVVYVRVSTLRQAQAQTIEQQLDRLRAWFAAHGRELTGEDVFRDEGYSGATLNRPGLDRLRDAVRAGEVERVLVTDPDRLARNYVQLMVLLEELERLGCQVEFLDRPIGRDPQDQPLLQIRGAVAEYERTLIAERMRRGRQMKLRAGCLLPWTRAPYGYRLDPDRPRDPAGVTVEPAEAAVVRELYASFVEEHSSLFSLSKRLRALGIVSPTGRACWSPATLRGILTNPTYTGQVFAGRWRARPPRARRSATHPIGRPSDSAVPAPAEQWLPVASVPALISPEQFERAQAKLARNRAFARRHNTRHGYLLRALVSCGVCRSSCLCRTVHPGYDYYVCRGKGDPITSRRDEPCPARYAPAHQLDELVWRDLCALLTDPGQIAQALARAHGGGWLPQDLQARRAQLRQGQLGLERQLERLTEAYLLGSIPLAEYQRRRQAMEDRMRALSAQADQLETQVDRQARLAGWAASAADFCQRVRTSLDDADFARRRQLVELLIDRVVVTEGEVEIRYVIPLSPDAERVSFCHLRKDYFDAVAIVVDPAWAGHGRLVFLGRDRRPGALVPDELAERVRRIAFVADDPAGNVGQAIDQILGQGKLMSLTGRQGEADRPTGAVGDHAGLGAITATRSAKRFTHVALCSRSPFFWAPAALWCALIDVPSRKAMPNSTLRSWTRSRSRSHTPSWLQRMKVCAARHQGTRSGGTLRHFAPF
jgi:site-specific DNA recombinase